MFFPKFPTPSDFTLPLFYKSLQEHLYLFKTFPEKKEVINKGEEFTIKFGVWNLMRRGVNFPNLWFKDVKLFLTGTRWAEPVNGFEEKININKDIGPFMQEFFEIKFVAKETIPETFFEKGLDFLEEIVAVRMTADVDFKKFFHFEKVATYKEFTRPEFADEEFFFAKEEEFVHKN